MCEVFSFVLYLLIFIGKVVAFCQTEIQIIIDGGGHDLVAGSSERTIENIFKDVSTNNIPLDAEYYNRKICWHQFLLLWYFLLIEYCYFFAFWNNTPTFCSHLILWKNLFPLKRHTIVFERFHVFAYFWTVDTIERNKTLHLDFLIWFRGCH